MLPWWPKEATLNLASEETLTLAGSSRYRWRNHLVMGGGIISLQVAASVGISKIAEFSHRLDPKATFILLQMLRILTERLLARNLGLMRDAKQRGADAKEPVRASRAG